MKALYRSAVLVLVGVLFGVGLSRVTIPLTAQAQTVSPSPAASAPMPMHSGMMAPGGGAAGCPMMNDMMRSAHGPADRMMMQGMMSMHRGMSSMQFSGNADQDFMKMMIPHHQAAINMAKAELRYGKDQRVLTLAKSIIAAQQKEIDEMHAWLK